MLNEPQRRAVETTKGRLLILAGAGSGKTRVIVERIGYLIQKKGVSPSHIVGLTFTNKAAKEMRERLSLLLSKEEARLVSLSTFHSFCMQILRKEIDKLGFTKEFSLYDEGDIERVMKQIARDMLQIQGDLPSLQGVKGAMAKVSQEGFLQGEDSSLWTDPFSKELYQKLQTTLRAHNALNFDNLLSLTIQLFLEHPEVLHRYQDLSRYILVDEYQDTNTAQFRLVELLAQKHQNICVVGDDDQSIYGWRGANIQNILSFRADCVIKLEQNYRSSPTIVQAASAVIEKNVERHPKTLWSAQPQGPLIEVFTAKDEREEVEGILARIVRLHDEEKIPFRDMAILYRSNALSRGVEAALLQAPWKKGTTWIRGIPYEIFGGLEFSLRSEIKDCAAFARVLVNPQDEEALLRILNVPRRGISDTFLETMTQTARKEEIPLWKILTHLEKYPEWTKNHPKGVLGVRSLLHLLQKAKERLHKEPPSTVLRDLLEQLPYKKAIEEEVKSEAMRKMKGENVEEFLHSLLHFEKESHSLADFVSSMQLQNAQKRERASTEDALQLLTLHSAKGLEFRVCFLLGLEDHILPHEKSQEERGIEEERRLLYVGITRAKERLFLSMARTRLRMGKAHPSIPSRFLFDIPPHLFQTREAKI